MKTPEQYEADIQRLNSALVTIHEEVSEMCRIPKKEYGAYDHKRVYQNIKIVAGKALKGKP